MTNELFFVCLFVRPGSFLLIFHYLIFFCLEVRLWAIIFHPLKFIITGFKFCGSIYADFLCMWNKAYILKFLLLFSIDFCQPFGSKSLFIDYFVGIFYQLLRKLYENLLLPFFGGVSISLNNSINFYCTYFGAIYQKHVSLFWK